MARYSREQRRRAVELYERYEHSAADVIREGAADVFLETERKDCCRVRSRGA